MCRSFRAACVVLVVQFCFRLHARTLDWATLYVDAHGFRTTGYTDELCRSDEPGALSSRTGKSEKLHGEPSVKLIRIYDDLVFEVCMMRCKSDAPAAIPARNNKIPSAHLVGDAMKRKISL